MTKIIIDHMRIVHQHEHILVARKRCRRCWYQMELKYNSRYEKFYPVQRRPWPSPQKYGRLGGMSYMGWRDIILSRKFGGPRNFSVKELNKMAAKWSNTSPMRGLVGWRSVAKKRRAE